jgi:MoaA/NifB/PqqE/SkfB family radical SAM enzyme
MSPERSDNQMLQDKTMMKIPSDAFEHQVQLIHFSGGGEPLTHPNTLPVAEKCKELGIKTAISTNGVLATKDLTRAFDHIRMSIDAATPHTYAKVKGAPLFNTVIANVRQVTESKGKADVGLGFVVGLDNYSEVEDFCQLAGDVRADFVHFRPCFYYNKEQNEKLRHIYETLEPPQTSYGNLAVYWRTDKFSGTWTQRSYTKCRATPLQAVLTANGQFTICQDVFVKWADYNTQTFDEIWNSIEHRQALEQIDLTKCPRCVETFHNQVIEHLFLSNECRNELI